MAARLGGGFAALELRCRSKLEPTGYSAPGAPIGLSERHHESLMGRAAETDTFRDLVWRLVRAIPRGKVMTYGQVAACLGTPRGARAVGYTLYFTPRESRVPCQRVVNRYGGLAAAYGWGGYDRHRSDLLDDGVEVGEDFTVDLARYRWDPDQNLIEELAFRNVRRTLSREASGRETQAK